MTTELDHYMQAVSRLREENAALRAERDALAEAVELLIGIIRSTQGRIDPPTEFTNGQVFDWLNEQLQQLLANPQTAASIAKRRAERAALADLLALFDYQQDRYPSEWNISVNFPEVVLRARAALAEPGQK